MLARFTLLAAFGAALLAAPAIAQQSAPPAAVTVMTLKARDVTLTTKLPGRVVASGTAEVRPQVNGIITKRLFKEGSEVKEGAPLYQIDAASYRAQVAAARASVDQAKARLSAAQKEAERQQQLLSRSVATQQNVDDAISTRDADAAALEVAQAQLLSANIDLDRTTIRAPLSGIVGLSQTTQGALVTAGQATALAVIRKLDPVYVDVTQSAEELIRWRKGKTLASLEGADKTVKLILADGSTYDHTGELTAAEPHVDEQTGVVVLRLTFPNPDRTLLPGMYVQVDMPQGVIHGAILAPQRGVSRDTRGNPTALVVTADNKVEERKLTVVSDKGNDWIVSKGLKSGDRIIIAGLQKVRPGMTVKPEEAAGPADDTSAAASAKN